MKRFVLFSSPKSKNFDDIVESLFPKDLENKVFAYLPTHKKYLNEEFTVRWQEIAKEHKAEFLYIDLEDEVDTKDKLGRANILLMTGGNTFWLLDRLRKTGLDTEIKILAEKEEWVIGGWSAGAMVLTPTIFVGSLPHRDGSKTPMDKNAVGLTDFTGLNLVNFEIFPHYEENLQKQTFENYQDQTTHEVKALTDDEYVVVNL